MPARFKRETTSPDPGLELHGRAITASAALELFLEVAAGNRSNRIRRAWEMMRTELVRVESVPVPALLARRDLGARQLAHGLEKEVELRYDVADDLEVPVELGDALDIALVGLLRAVIETGIETSDARDFAGKPRAAQIAVRCFVDGEHWVLQIEDDGHGRSTISTHPIADAETGGTFAMRSRPDLGTTWTVTFPRPQRQLQVRHFTVAGLPLVFAVADDWSAFAVAHGDGVIDLPGELGIGPAVAPTTSQPVDPLILQLQRGDQRVYVGAASEPVLGDARWVVATPPDRVAGVISIDGKDALLVRPDVLDQRATRVAVVDDSEIVRELVAVALEPHGVEVTPFAEPAALLGSKAPVDLVLIAPGFRGLDLATVVTCIKSARESCVVYLYSDRTPSELAVLAEATGADGAISKTLAREQFVTRALRILRAVNRRAR